MSRPWNRTRKATQPGLIAGRLSGVAGPLEGARITVRPVHLVARSSNTGSFLIAIPSQEIREGLLTVSIQAIGYRPYRTEVRMEAGDSAQLAVTLCRQTIQLTQIAAGGLARLDAATRN